MEHPESVRGWGVLESAKYIADRSLDVSIDSDGVDATAELVCLDNPLLY